MFNTITQIKRLIGAKRSEANITAELETHANFNTIELPDGTIGYEVMYSGEEAKFSSVQICAMLLTKVKQIVLLNNPSCQTVDMVISVPPFFTDSQRRAIKDAAQIAQINCLRLLNEGTSAALSYGIFKGAKKEFAEGKETMVLFLDMGHASFIATVASFTNASLKILASVADNDLGSRNLDVAIAKQFAEEFKTKHKIDAWKNKKARVKLMVAAEKAKVSISPHGVNQTPVSIECLLEDKDYNGNLSAEKLDEMCWPDFSARIGSVIQRALTQSNTRDYADFAAIELVGGGMRPRLVKRACAIALKMNLDEANGHGLNQSMNLDEAVARGCALACASLSPVFKVKPFEITDITSYGVQLSWDGASSSSDAAGMEDDDNAAAKPAAGASSVVIFKAGDPVCTRQVTLRKTGTFSASLEYVTSPEHSSVFPAGAATQLGKYTISGFPTDIGAEATKVRLMVKYDFDGCVSISHAELLREITAQSEAAAENADMDAAEKKDANEGGDAPSSKKKRFKRFDLKVELDTSAGVAAGTGVCPGSGMHAAALRDAVDAELRMCRQDADIRATQDTRNSLEAFIYSTRSALEENLKPFGTEKERSDISSALTDAETWLYGDGFESDTKTYKARLKDLEVKSAGILGRKWENDNRRIAGEALQTSIDEVLAAANNSTQRHAHLSAADKDILRSTADKAAAWYTAARAEQNNRELFNDPTLRVADITAKRDALLREALPIMNQKPPQAANAPAPAASTQAPAADQASMDTDDNAAKGVEGDMVD
jgi:heat shock protein 4